MKTIDKDIRIYTYESGGLKKFGYTKAQHIYSSLEAAERALEIAKKRWAWANMMQFVIVEYTDKYESKIVEIL